MENDKDNLPASFAYFECKACGKKRFHPEINVFKHPMVEENSTKIDGYHHFNYCYDNLICYMKAARNERCKKNEVNQENKVEIL